MSAEQFNLVFLTIKKYCGNNGLPEGDKRIQLICDETKISIIRLGYYLRTLEDLGLIMFTEKEGFIKLTSFGKKVDRLFY
jgi:hypothetical protein